MGVQSKIRQAIKIWNTTGLPGVRARISWNKHKAAEARAYDRWLKIHGTPDERARGEMRRKIAEFRSRPLISILLPVYNVDENWLRLCVASVRDQIYENWELCIADDCSTKPHIRSVLDEYADLDLRIKVVYRAQNGHISAASNSALDLATGEFAVLLDHDDELSADALFWVANELNSFPETAMIYSDEDMIDTRGRRSEPKFKPDFSRDLLYSLNLVTHLSAYRTELMRSIGGFRVGFEGSQDYDLALRIVEHVSEHQIRHIPRILYHWRAIAGSVALSSDEKPYAHDRARAAIGEHLSRAGIGASVGATHYNLHRVKYDLAEPPSVSIVTDAMSDASLGRLIASTAYTPYDIVLLSSVPREALRNVASSKIVVSAEADRSKRLNLGAGAATGEIIIFVNGALVPHDGDWLTELVRLASQPQIGAVGGRVLSTDETVWTGGLVVGAGGGAAAAHRGFPISISGNMGRNQVIGNFSAVSEFCMAVKREDFNSVGGFDEKNLPNSFFAADLCLRLGELGRRIAMTPYAKLVHTVQAQDIEPSAGELEYLQKRWPRQMSCDPFYNPNLSKRDGTFSIEV